jgi:uncharacterized protein YndB with AHSA1/START domain
MRQVYWGWAMSAGLALCGLAGALHAQDMEEAPAEAARIAQQSRVLDAPVADVWAAFTTTEGYSAWAAPFAEIDFRVGGTIEASYAENPVLGDPANIIIEIQAYLPERLLVLKTVQAPPGVADEDTLARLVSVFEFEDLGDQTTRLTISGVGYTEADQVMRDSFADGINWTMSALETYLAAT